MITIFIILSWISYGIISSAKGIYDGYLWHYWLESWFKKILNSNTSLKGMQNEGKYLHKIGSYLTALPLLIILLGALALNFSILKLLFLGISLSTVNPLFHLGYMFHTRNKLNNKTYTDSFKSTHTISDGNTDKFKKLTVKLFNTYKKRVIFAIISIITLLLSIFI